MPLKHYTLRQTTGSGKERREDTVVPGVDFDYDEGDDLDLKELVQDSGERLQLTVIDTPGLSDSGNGQSSNSGMRVIDERHRLRILFALQKIEDVHAICLVVRRDTSYSGDFQDLIRKLRELFMFSIRSTAWNLNFHIVHTNIDVDDRASNLCQIRQQDFDKFGPPGAVHHFINNLPDADSPLEMFCTNQALSDLFRSLSTHSSTKFLDLQYPKSSEQKNNDQMLTNGIRLAISTLKERIESHELEIVKAKKEIERDRPKAELIKKRVDEYDRKLQAIDCDTLSIIDGASEEASTDINAFGGGGRYFSFTTPTRISEVSKWNNGNGTWIEETRKEFSYSVKLQPNWAASTYGSVTLKAKKKDKHADLIASLRKKREPVAKEWQTFVDKSKEAEIKRAGLREEIKKMEFNLIGLRRDLTTVEHSGHSISLALGASLVKYFTLDTPIAAALGYNLQTLVPWTVSPLDEVSRGNLKKSLDSGLSDSRQRLKNLKAKHQRLTALLGQAHSIARIIGELAQPPLGTAQVHSIASLLGELVQAADHLGAGWGERELEDFFQLLKQLERLSESRRSGKRKDDDMVLVRVARPAAERSIAFVGKVAEDINDTLTSIQEATVNAATVQAAAECLGCDEGVPTEIFSWLAKGTCEDINERFLPLFRELRDVVDLAEVVLD